MIYVLMRTLNPTHSLTGNKLTGRTLLPVKDAAFGHLTHMNAAGQPEWERLAATIYRLPSCVAFCHFVPTNNAHLYALWNPTRSYIVEPYWENLLITHLKALLVPFILRISRPRQPRKNNGSLIYILSAIS